MTSPVATLDALLAPAVPEPEEAFAWPRELGDHLSASRLTMFQRCPEQYRRRYVLGQKEKPGAALVWGSADHYAHEQNFKQKVRSGEDIPEADVRLAFAEGFDRAVERNGGEAEVVWGDEKPGALKDAGTELVAVYHRVVSPRVQPVAVEEKFCVWLENVLVPVIGYVDVQTATRAIERKTARAAQRSPKPDWRIQGLLYQAVHDADVEWHVSVKTKTPAVYTAGEEPALRLPVNRSTVEATKQLVSTLTRAMVAYWRMYGPEEPWPGAITHPWACSFCGYRPTCRWWAA